MDESAISAFCIALYLLRQRINPASVWFYVQSDEMNFYQKIPLNLNGFRLGVHKKKSGEIVNYCEKSIFMPGTKWMFKLNMQWLKSDIIMQKNWNIKITWVAIQQIKVSLSLTSEYSESCANET